jgi:hypothetical protein
MTLALSQCRDGDPLWNSSVAPAISNSDETKKRKCSQIRVVTRIRPLTKDEKEARSQPSIYPITAAKDANDRARNSNDWGNLLSRVSPERRRASSPPPLSSSSRSGSAPNVKRNVARQKAQVNPTSLLAGTENRIRFDFDAVLGPEATQKEVYNHSVGDTIRRNVSRGIDTTIIAIGQDGSGKSYTMSGGWKTETGSNKNEGPTSPVDEDDGILPRAIHDLFKTKQRYSLSAEVGVTMSFVEISNEGLRDLLADSESSPLQRKSQREGSDLKEIECTSWVEVDSAAKVKRLMDRASKQRTKNKYSARCHLFCSFHITIKPQGTTKTGNSYHPREETSTKLTLVNLAAPKAATDGGTRQHAMVTNKDMHYLEEILQSLTENGKRTKLSYPYQECNLTKTLGDALQGKVLILCRICVTLAHTLTAHFIPPRQMLYRNDSLRFPS